MAAFNVNIGNKMVMQSALQNSTPGRGHFHEYVDETCGCLGKSKSSKKKAERQRIKQFSIWFEEKDSARQKTYAQRRFDREAIREKRKKRVRCFRKLLIPTAICWLVGFVLIMGSTVRSLGEGTIFWNIRDKLHIIGPVVLGTGLVLLMITEGCISNHQTKIRKLESIILTPEVNIVVNGKGNIPVKNVKNPGQKTLKTISGKLPQLQKVKKADKSTETTPFLFIEDEEQAVRPKTYSFSQNMESTKTRVHVTTVKHPSEIYNEDYKLPLATTANLIESENTALDTEENIVTEYEQLLKATKEDNDHNLLGAIALDIDNGN
ncbi:unnamed protein product [Mytilus coruscus]|uniref:Uncharacterized protein n=1 Tax=Mytilus coruscus TaxID=42192 RepID=A0A6J8EKA3_MYTCO|nr:unnamed protein product [Mytilus coruscus]